MKKYLIAISLMHLLPSFAEESSPTRQQMFVGGIVGAVVLGTAYYFYHNTQNPSATPAPLTPQTPPQSSPKNPEHAQPKVSDPKKTEKPNLSPIKTELPQGKTTGNKQDNNNQTTPPTTEDPNPQTQPKKVIPSIINPTPPAPKPLEPLQPKESPKKILAEKTMAEKVKHALFEKPFTPEEINELNMMP